ncbi:hypothetical protein GM668_18595 [Duganella ginsengisoli]|uniref:Uncharacterized protein n=1 Tax=Pseudoduganella ginsengisoli TaxID=1462440 RepID=A0A6L6Q3Q7_9BURK|nr:hypothetical protein [Pseudoduganella ginsengisoli]
MPHLRAIELQAAGTAVLQQEYHLEQWIIGAISPYIQRFEYLFKLNRLMLLGIDNILVYRGNRVRENIIFIMIIAIDQRIGKHANNTVRIWHIPVCGRITNTKLLLTGIPLQQHRQHCQQYRE